MHKISKLVTFFTLSTILTTNATEIIGKIEIQSLTQTANNVTKFTKPIAPVLPIAIAGGLIAASFSKKYSSFDISSPLRVGIFTEDKMTSPLWCFSIDNRRTPKKEYIKLGGIHLFYKKNKSRLIMSDSKKLLSGINQLHSPQKSSSDISLEINPKLYLEKCPMHFNSLKASAIKSLSDGKTIEQKEKISEQADTIQNILMETELFSLNLSVTDKFILINSLLKPADSTQLKMIITQLSSQNTELKFPNKAPKQSGISVDTLGENIDLILQMIAPNKVVSDKDKAMFTKIISNSSGSLNFKNDTAILDLQISQETAKMFIPKKYLSRSHQRQRIKF